MGRFPSSLPCTAISPDNAGTAGTVWGQIFVIEIRFELGGKRSLVARPLRILFPDAYYHVTLESWYICATS
jgi:hypothetical protein